MKKILLAFDDANFSQGAFDFVKQLNKLQPVSLTGLFIPQTEYANLWSYAAAATGGVYVPLVEDEDIKAIEENIHKFENLCAKNSIKFKVRKDFFDLALPELKKESRFADVLVLSGELFFQDVMFETKIESLREASHNAECPVVVVPEHFKFPSTNILAYDGSESSVYAIKQFAYIFPELAKNPTLLVYAEGKEDKDFPAKDHINDLVSQHYPNLTFYRLEANPKKYFNAWINEREGTILISGSFSRSAFSQMFRQSFVAQIIREHHLPVFIAHK